MFFVFPPEPHADLRLIALSDRRQMEEGASMVFESKSGRLYYGSLNELMKITSPTDKTPKQPSLPSNPSSVSVEPSATTLNKQKKRRQRKNRQKKLEESANQSTSSTESSDSERFGSSSDDASSRRADEWMDRATPAKPDPPSPDSRLYLKDIILVHNKSDLGFLFLSSLLGTSLNTIYAKWMRLVCMATANGDTEGLVELLNGSNSTSSCKFFFCVEVLGGLFWRSELFGLVHTKHDYR